jgi:lactoylglutathione lyase
VAHRNRRGPHRVQDTYEEIYMKLRIIAALITALACLQVAEAQGPTAPLPDPHPAMRLQLAYTSYYVLDQKRSLDFYVGLLGMRERQRITPSPGVTEIVLGFDKDPQTPGILLMHRADRKTPYQIGDGFSRTILRVSDIKAMMQRLSEAGVAVVRQPTAVADLRLTYSLVRDPDGYIVELIQIH